MSSTLAQNVDVTEHAHDRWTERSSQPWRDLEIVWRETFEIDFPAAHSGADSFYHPPTEIVLLVQDLGHLERVVTCIDLNDRPDAEQDYVRNQVSDQ